MKKIKLIISDLHIHTGALLPDGERNAFEEFLDDGILVEFIQHFSTGEYAEYDVELIVNGDFFNMLEIEFVTGEPTETITEAVAAEQMSRIIDGHPQLFETLHTFIHTPHKSLTLVIGNHDAALLFPAVQKLLHKRLSPKVLFAINHSFDRVFIAHGNQYEFLHHFDMRNFTYRGPDGEERLRLPWGSLFVIQWVRQMKQRRPYLNRIKPFANYQRWAFWNDHRFWWRMLVGIIRFWFVNRFSRIPERRKEFRFSPIRMLNAMNHRPLLRTARQILEHTHYRLVVFGHSHDTEYRRIGKQGEYFNTGSWNELISLDVASLGRNRLRPYVRIDYENDVPRATLNNWIGSHRLTHELIP